MGSGMNELLPSAMDGYTHIHGDAAWIRLSDVVWEWFKPLNPWQVNAVKSLVSVDALADERHPLRKGGPEGYLELFVGIFPGGKPRLLMSLRQLEYIQYYIKAMKLIQPTPEAIERYRDALQKLRSEEQDETRSQALSDDQEDDVVPDGTERRNGQKQDEGEFDIAKLADVPLPSSKYFVLKDDLLDIAPIQLHTDDDVRRAIKNPRPWFQLAKGLRTAPISDSVSGGTSTRPLTPVSAGEEAASRDVEEPKSEAASQEPLEKEQESEELKDEERSNDAEAAGLGPGKEALENLTGPALLFQRAEQAYLAASQGSDFSPDSLAASNSKTQAPLGPASFLTIDSQVWEEEYGVLLDVGWSGCWFEREDVPGDDGTGIWVEKRGGGHWIIKENEHRLNSAMKCSVEGKITRIPYVGTGASEVLPLKDVLSKVEGLVPMMQKRSHGGCVFIVVHSNDKDVGALRQLGLPIATWELDIEAARPTAKNDVFVIDTSEMVATISNANNKQKDPEYTTIARSACTLERLANHLLKDHPVLSCVTGNSGNAADAKMECFLVMVIKGLEGSRAAFGSDSAEPQQQDEPDAADATYDSDFIEALARQDDADRTILLHEQARRQREILLRTGQVDQTSACDSEEDQYDSEEEDRKLLEEFEIDYEIGYGGPEEGIEDD